jgi:hypothetical protein
MYSTASTLLSTDIQIIEKNKKLKKGCTNYMNENLKIIF